jgi:para-nitrobenzyl esterase
MERLRAFLYQPSPGLTSDWLKDRRFRLCAQFALDCSKGIFAIGRKMRNAVMCHLILGAVLLSMGSDGVLSGVAEPLSEEIRLLDGPIRGERIGENLLVYRGIPFAAPPVGDLRWKPPQPVASWNETRNSIAFGNACPQPPNELFGPEAQAMGPISEDCLYLNVWTAARQDDEKRPVMFWIHGGGFTTGAGSMPMYDGGTLARDGVVLVTINYRLGPFGFFAHPLLSAESPHNASGNYGLLDQIAALEWVHRNIARFGGDPGNVTIFGESAGSASVCRLLVSPLSRGLFHRAIAQSGGVHGRNKHLRENWDGTESAEAMGERLQRRLVPDAAGDPMAALRRVPAEELLKAAAPAVGLYGQGDKYRPVVDGWVLPDDPGRLFDTGKAQNVPFLTGTNADEGTIFIRQLPIRRKTGYRLILRSIAQDRADDIEKLFPVETADAIPDALNKLTTALAFVAPARAMVRALDRQNTPAYLYHFTRVPASPLLKTYGAFHSLEIAYIFGNFRGALTAGPADNELSKTVRAYWIQFARTGDPNLPSLPGWPAYSKKSDVYLEIGDSIKIGTRLYKDACDIFDEMTDEHYSRLPEIR